VTPANQQPRPRLFDRFLLRIAHRRLVDGLWVAVSNVTDQSSEPILDCVEDALRVIEKYDTRRYYRLQRDLERIWVRLQTRGNTGLYNFDLAACELDPRYVLREDVQPSDIASVIVHEAAHARLNRFGLRSRLEAACRKQEYAFSERLPLSEGNRIREKLSRMDRVSDEFWSDASLMERRKRAVDRALEYMRVPRWMLPVLKLIGRVVRLTRGFVRAVLRLAGGLTCA
jgi:hypothetical protein